MRRLRSPGEGIRSAVGSLRAHPLRSGLTALGVAVGVAVVVTVAALVTGIRTSVLDAFEAAGPGNFIVTRFDMTDVRLVGDGQAPPWAGRPKVTREEARAIGRLPGIREAVVDVDFAASVSYGGRRITDVQSSGNSAGWPAYTLGSFVDGRNFIDSEVRQSSAVVVVSRLLARELFGPLDPVGRRVRMSGGGRAGVPFTVIGVFEPETQVFAEAVQHFAVVPHTAALETLGVSDAFLSALVVPDEEVDQETAMDRVIGALRSMRGLAPAETNDFSLLRSEQLRELFDQLTGVFFLVTLALSSVGLTVGGVGVVGIMMIAVTERTREIGIRKAVGATRGEILWQFLVEASLLTVVGAAIGMLLGAGAAEAVAARTPVPARIPAWSVAAGLAMAVLTGIALGLLPAVRASRLDPVEALRHE